MSHFYGTVDGAGKTTASRRGHKNSPVTTVAASWSGAVITQLRHEDGRDYYRVVEVDWPSRSLRRVISDWRQFGI